MEEKRTTRTRERKRIRSRGWKKHKKLVRRRGKKPFKAKALTVEKEISH